jgi:hypothetical protein
VSTTPLLEEQVRQFNEGVRAGDGVRCIVKLLGHGFQLGARRVTRV